MKLDALIRKLDSELDRLFEQLSAEGKRNHPGLKFKMKKIRESMSQLRGISDLSEVNYERN